METLNSTSDCDKCEDRENHEFTEGTEDRIPPSIYFGGSAWGCAFYVGVYKAMEERWGKDFRKNCTITGDSSGALFALGISLGFTAEEMEGIYKGLADSASIHGVMGRMGSLAEKSVEILLSADPFAYKSLASKFAVGTTTFPFNHQWHWTWESNRDLAQCMIGSLHIPLYCDKQSAVQGNIVVDGAYSMSGKDLVHGDDTLYVGIDPHAEVGRSLQNNQMLFPLTGDEYLAVMESGYHAMKNWDGKMKAKVGYRQPNYPVLLLMWPCRALELVMAFLSYVFRYIWKCVVGIWKCVVGLFQPNLELFSNQEFRSKQTTEPIPQES